MTKKYWLKCFCKNVPKLILTVDSSLGKMLKNTGFSGQHISAYGENTEKYELHQLCIHNARHLGSRLLWK